MTPLSVPCIKGNEWKYIKECLDTGWVSSAGPYVDMFEKKMCEYTGSNYAVACVNGTAALHIALKLGGVQPGDEVIVPTLTFIATVNVVRYLNSDPVFMDADKHYNMDVEKTIEFIQRETIFKNGVTFNKITNKRISAIIPVHVFGNAVDLEPLIGICKDRNITIIEDAAESLGTVYRSGELQDKPCGTIGTLGCLSFNGNKIITTGGGGMLLTDDAGLAEKARYLTTQAKDDSVRFIHDDVGYNFRLSNIQAAMGVAQLEQLRKFLKAKKNTYNTYKERVNVISGLKVAAVPDYADNNHWMVAMQIDKETYAKEWKTLMEYFRQKGIETRPIWHLNHLQKQYKNCQTYKIEKAFELMEKTLNIPCSVGITTEQIDAVIGHLIDASLIKKAGTCFAD